MGNSWDRFIQNCEKSVEIGIIRYSLYNLSVIIVPMILMLLPLIGMFIGFMFMAEGELISTGALVFGLIMLVVNLLLSAYTENCAWKAYVHTLKTGEKLGYKEYLKGGTKGYWSYLGKSVVHVVVPIMVVGFLIGTIYIIPVVGDIVANFLLSLLIAYVVYRFYSMLLGVDYGDFKLQLKNYIVLIIISSVVTLIGSVALDLVVSAFLTPITLIIILSKMDKDDTDNEYVKY